MALRYRLGKILTLRRADNLRGSPGFLVADEKELEDLITLAYILPLFLHVVFLTVSASDHQVLAIKALSF
jgi:hypothetical protein